MTGLELGGRTRLNRTNSVQCHPDREGGSWSSGGGTNSHAFYKLPHTLGRENGAARQAVVRVSSDARSLVPPPELPAPHSRSG
jgi:hypothetical protein